MEENKQKGKGVEYNPFIMEDKHYFGGFFNLAANNLEQVAEEFRIRLHLKEGQNKLEVIYNYFAKERISITDWERGINLLKDYLPIIHYLDLPITHRIFDNCNINNRENERKRYFLDGFKNLSKAIFTLRNYFTHYYHEELVFEDSLFKLLDTTLLEVCQDVKRQKMKTDKTKQTLKKQLAEELKILVKLEKEYQKSKKIKTWNKDENIEGAIYNNAFSHIMIKNKAGVQVLNDRYKSKFVAREINIESKINITHSGIVFLLSMFLNNKESENLKANISGYKGKIYGTNDFHLIDRRNNSMRNMATHWVFSFLTYKGLKHRVKNTFDKETLMMQMIDELSKVPNEVYYNLSKSEQEKFIEDINEYVQDNEENEKGLAESTIVHPVIRKRYGDKFNYFAIRYIDEFLELPTLRFQVHAGNYIHDHRSKRPAGLTFDSERIIKEKINVYEKISEINKQKSDFFKKLDEDNHTSWELFPNPNYVFIGNNIQIKINLFKYEMAKEMSQELIKIKNQIQPKKKRENNKPTKEDIIQEIFGKETNTGHATILFSLNELPALLYEVLINKKSGIEIEKIIVDKMIEHYLKLKNYDGQLENKNDIPKTLKRNIQEKQLNNTKIENDINIEIEKTKEKLKLIETNIQEVIKGERKIVFRTRELGIEATWLVYDIVRFMPKDKKVDWKGNYHSELQCYLSQYDRNKEQAKQLLNLFWPLERDMFFGSDIYNAFKANHFVDFYKNYLNSRHDLFLGMLESFKGFKNEPKILKKIIKVFFKIFDERLYYFQPTEYIKNYILSKPMNLPRGIFDDRPTQIPNTSIKENPALYAAHHQYVNNSEIKFQSFYNLTLDYIDNYTFQEKQISKDKFIKQQFEKIKLVKRKDIFTKLMADDIFKKTFHKNLPYSLEDLYQNQEERLKNIAIAHGQKDRQEGDDFENIYNLNFIWNKTVSLNLFDGRIIEPKVKIKDIGKFRSLENDPKVQVILSYDEQKVWTKLELEDELENKPNAYEKIRRTQFFKNIQVFEKSILELYPNYLKVHPKVLEIDNAPSFRKYIIEGILKRIGSIESQEIDYIDNQVTYANESKIDFEKIESLNPLVQRAFYIILIRNTFAHNKLPSKQVYQNLLNFKSKTEDTYADYFNTIVVAFIETLKNSIR